jgi:CRP/FNR family transcriptional regulator, cyclic AMP receptor protein
MPPDSPESARRPRRTVRSEHLDALPDDLGALRRFGARKTWPSGAILFRQGGEPHTLFVIEEGEVELVHETKHERLIVEIVRAGGSVGDLPVLLETPYLYTAVTRTETTTLDFDLEKVRSLLEIDPQLCFLWLRLLSERVDRGHRRLVGTTGRTAGQRLAHFLVREAEDAGSASVTLTQRELASALGLSRQTVARELGRFEQLGLVERGRGHVRVLDEDRLRALLPP